MKLSQMTSDMAADVMIQIAPDIEMLANDAELGKMVSKREKTTNQGEAVKFGGLLVMKVAVHVLKEHRQSVWNILGALQQKTAAEIAEQSVMTVFAQIVETLNDKDFMSFFSLLKTPARET